MKLITLGNLETFKNNINENCSKSNYKNKIATTKEQMDTGKYLLGYYSYYPNIGVYGNYISKGTYSVENWNKNMEAIFGRAPEGVYGGPIGPIAKKFYATNTVTIIQNKKTLFTFNTADKTCYLIGLHNSGSTRTHISLFSSSENVPNSIGMSNDHIILYCSNSTDSLSNYKSFPITLSADLYFKD